MPFLRPQSIALNNDFLLLILSVQMDRFLHFYINTYASTCVRDRIVNSCKTLFMGIPASHLPFYLIRIIHSCPHKGIIVFFSITVSLDRMA